MVEDVECIAGRRVDACYSTCSAMRHQHPELLRSPAPVERDIEIVRTTVSELDDGEQGLQTRIVVFDRPAEEGEVQFAPIRPFASANRTSSARVSSPSLRMMCARW